jgi:hypothetical protein
MIFIQSAGALTARDTLPEMSAPVAVKVTGENDDGIGCRHRLSLEEKSI